MTMPGGPLRRLLRRDRSLPAWDTLTPVEKVAHLRGEHDYRDRGGDDDWIPSASVAALDALHRDDHGEYEGGGGNEKHAHQVVPDGT